jgi:hypothetical protein
MMQKKLNLKLFLQKKKPIKRKEVPKKYLVKALGST